MKRMADALSARGGLSWCVAESDEEGYCLSTSPSAVCLRGQACREASCQLVADSPTPLAPMGWCGDGVTMWPLIR